MMKENVIQYKINQMVDSGLNVTLSLTEDVELEPLTQQQLMLDAIDNVVTDKEVKEQIKPFLEAILRSQPQTVINSYPQVSIQLTMPKRRYEKIGRPQVGENLVVEIKRP
jgi:hypothetical protein